MFAIADDQLLARTLVAGRENGKTALVAIEGLHGVPIIRPDSHLLYSRRMPQVNNFTQAEWKVSVWSLEKNTSDEMFTWTVRITT